MYDESETVNPLGSKRGVHKIGALYFVLRNLPPKLNSALMNIHLVALFHTEDVKKYGFDPILQPLINDIKTLESHGIDLPFSTEKVHYMSDNWGQLRDAQNSGLYKVF